MKKTRRGNILKIVREHYLRDDISCGSELCTQISCLSSNQNNQPKTAINLKSKTVLESKPVSPSSLFSDPHYIIPDTNIILHQVIE